MQSDTTEIIEKIRSGSQLAFRQLVEQYQQYAFNLAFRIIGNDEEAKDIVQDSFIKIWKNIKDYDHKVKFTTWMYKIVTNTTIDKLRSLKRHSHVELNHISEKLQLISIKSPDNQLENKDLGQIIRYLADDLPEKQRLVFVLRDIQGFSSVETQEIMELPETSIKSNLYHARKIIREKLNKMIDFERGSK